MNKSPEERKAIALETLTSSSFDTIMPSKLEELAKALKLPFDSKTQVKDMKENLARWMVDNFPNIRYLDALSRNEIEGYFATIFPAGPSREFLISIMKAFRSKLFGMERPMQAYESAYMKTANPYMGYPMNYMYPNQQYMMPMSMYPPYPSDQQSYENMEKMYKMHNPYYMHMPMQYQFNHVDSSRLSYPYPMFNPQPQGISEMQNYYQNQNPAMRKPTEPPKLMSNFSEPKQPSTCASRSTEEHEQAFKRYQQIYGKEAFFDSPFTIIPPSRQEQKKKQPQYHHLIPNNSNNNNNQPSSSSRIPLNMRMRRNKEQSSEIEVLDVNSQAVKGFKQQKKAKEINSNTNGNISKNDDFQKKVVYDEKFKFCECKGTKNGGQFYRCKNCAIFYHYSCTLKKQKSQNKKQVVNADKEQIVQIDIIDDENEKQKEKMGEQNKQKGSKQQCDLQKKKDQEFLEEQREEICHFCFMKNIDPLNEVIKIAKTCYIRKIYEAKVLETCNFQPFDNYIIIKNSPYEIELRCMRLEDASNEIAEYTWPDECLVTLNNEKTIEFPALQTNSSVKKRKDMSVFLTNNIFNFTKNMNQRHHSRIGIEIKYISNSEIILKKIRNNHIFVFGIYLSKKKTVDQLYEQIMMDPSNKVNFVENYFATPVDEEEVAIEQIKVNLVDPYSWMLINTPARGIKCNHGQCFDLKTFLGFMNVQRNRNWKCPVCNKQCRRFCVDLEQLGVIEEYKREGDAKKLSKEVTFHRDGRTIFSLNQDSEMEDENNQNKEEKYNQNQMDEEKIENISKIEPEANNSLQHQHSHNSPIPKPEEQMLLVEENSDMVDEKNEKKKENEK